MTKPTARELLSYAAGLAVAASLTACGGAGSTDGSPSTSTSPSATSSVAAPTSTAPTSTAATSGSSSATSSEAPDGRTLSVRVKGRQVTPRPSTVDLAVGERLTLTVTADRDNVLHIHGFDVEKDLVAGRPLTVTLTGRQPGTYDVETHEPELRLLRIAVR